MWKPEFLSMILSAFVSVLTLFTFFQSRMTSTEKRLTVLEEKNKQNDKELEETKGRLDNHDLQMQVLIQMTEQIKNLSEKIEKIENDGRSYRDQLEITFSKQSYIVSNCQYCDFVDSTVRF